MNSPPSQATVALDLPHGRIVWGEGQRVAISTPSGAGAGAGDGIAVDLARLLTGVPLPPGVRVTVDAALPVLHGIERGFSSDIDMTNWNLVVDEALIVKVVGRLGDGDRAVRLGRAISRHAPHSVPSLHGTIELVTDEGTRVVATVSEYLHGSSDGWTWAVDDALRALDTGTRSQWPSTVGALVARVHRALEEETRVVTAPASVRSEPVVRASADHIIPDAGPASARLHSRWASLTAAISTTPPVRTPRFAIHGDLHVGQILRDRLGVLRLIDLDGDPQGGFDPDSADAAVDLAHLLVSIDLVGAIVAKRRGEDDPRILQWCNDCRADLVAAYQASGDVSSGVALLDESRLAGLEAEQLLREVRYAQRFLPRWRYASDWAITHRYTPDPDMEDPPWTPPALSTT